MSSMTSRGRDFAGDVANMEAISEARGWAVEAWGEEGDGRDLGHNIERGFALSEWLEADTPDPETVLIAAEEDDAEVVMIGLQNDPMVAAPQPMGPTTQVHMAA